MSKKDNEILWTNAHGVPDASIQHIGQKSAKTYFGIFTVPDDWQPPQEVLGETSVANEDRPAWVIGAEIQELFERTEKTEEFKVKPTLSYIEGIQRIVQRVKENAQDLDQKPQKDYILDIMRKQEEKILSKCEQEDIPEIHIGDYHGRIPKPRATNYFEEGIEQMKSGRPKIAIAYTPEFIEQATSIRADYLSRGQDVVMVPVRAGGVSIDDLALTRKDDAPKGELEKGMDQFYRKNEGE